MQILSQPRYAVRVAVSTILLVLLCYTTQPVSAQYPRMEREVHVLSDLDYSRDGQRIVLAGDSIRVVDAASKELVQTISTTSRSTSVRCSPVDGEVFAIDDEDGVVSIFEIGKSKPRQNFPPSTQPNISIRSLAWSPDGKLLAASGCRYAKGVVNKSICDVWEVATGKRLFGLNYDDINCRCVTFSPDGKQLAIALGLNNSQGSSLLLVSTEDWSEQRRISFSPGFALEISFTPDSRHLIAVGGFCKPSGEGCRPTGRIWYATLDSNDPPKMFVPAAHTEYFRGVAPLTDEQFFVAVSEKYKGGFRQHVQMWSADTGGRMWARMDGRGDAIALRMSPDKETVAYLNRGRRAYELKTISVSGAPRNADQTTLFQLPFKRVAGLPLDLRGDGVCRRFGLRPPRGIQFEVSNRLLLSSECGRWCDRRRYLTSVQIDFFDLSTVSVAVPSSETEKHSRSESRGGKQRDDKDSGGQIKNLTSAGSSFIGSLIYMRPGFGK